MSGVPDPALGWALVGLLAAAVALAGIVGPVVMRALSRPLRGAPGLLIVCWLALVTALPLGAVAAAVVGTGMLAPVAPSGGMALAGLLQACAHALRQTYLAGPGPDLPATLTAGFALALVLRLLLVGARRSAAGVARWRRCRRALARSGVATRCDGVRIWRFPNECPDAFCLPGPRTRIAVSAGVLDTLEPAQAAAVIAHERAHVLQRHHVWLAWTNLMVAAFPFVPACRAAAVEVPRLVERAADRSASRRYGVSTLARALTATATALSSSQCRARRLTGALHMSGPDTAARMAVLLEQPRPPRWPIRIGLVAAVCAWSAVPLALVLVPVVHLLGVGACLR